jgi:hypothetical protein
VHEFTVFKGNVKSGLMHISGTEGEKTGVAMAERLGPDKFKVTLKIVNPDGAITESSGEMTRKK